jgi:hypothetical protein
VTNKKTAPVKGPLLLPLVVMAFDDYRPVASVPISVPVPAPVPTAVMVTEFGACTAKIVAITELTSITEMIAADANANAKIFRASYGRSNGNNRQRSKRETKLSHVPSSSQSCPIKETMEPKGRSYEKHSALANLSNLPTIKKAESGQQLCTLQQISHR